MLPTPWATRRRRAGDATVKIVSMLALTAAFSYNVALIAGSAGAVGVRAGDVDDAGTVGYRSATPFWCWSGQRLRRRSPQASRCAVYRRAAGDVLLASAIVPVAAGDTNALQDRVAAGVLHRHLELHRVAFFTLTACTPLPSYHCDGSTWDSMVMAAPPGFITLAGQLNCKWNVAVGGNSLPLNSEQFHVLALLEGGRPVVKQCRPPRTQLMRALLALYNASSWSLRGGRFCRAISTRPGCPPRRCGHDARPGLVVLVTGTQRAARCSPVFVARRSSRQR